MDVSTLLALAQNATDVGNCQAAQEFFEVALTCSPNNIDVLEAYAELMIHHLQDIPRAKQMLQHAIEVDPQHGYVKYLNLAQLCDSNESLECYQRALQIVRGELDACRKKRRRETLNETLSTIYCAIAELYLTDLCYAPGAEQLCEEAIVQALKCNGRSVEAHQLQASLRLSQNRSDEALQSLRRAVDLTHRLSEAYQPTYGSKVELSRLLMQVSPDEAYRFLLEILQLGDNNPYIWFLLGESARLRKRYADSARLLRRARVMLTMSDGAAEALQEVDAAIAVLVEEMGGPAVVEQIADLDHPNPIELLTPEDERDEEGDDDNEDMEKQEWESCDDED
ncbi:TPR domain protein [Trypanosoma rangeli]|uniref:TPR domain protein n=1 Tax=Trypanosoma rangeli TaxID=5698 RepID=A0A3R7LYN1_TRYRA|nr:TPR domain protein [Trypanosoma rangeli]RNF05889.1 TPR domain protein [Trypanosoma rangeli]|eukprot:RNF05889.1 TPR domain protein [Trypanosoma rangeli]